MYPNILNIKPLIPAVGGSFRKSITPSRTASPRTKKGTIARAEICSVNVRQRNIRNKRFPNK